MRVDSPQGQGTSLTVTLPITPIIPVIPVFPSPPIPD
jgi:hypothetical protein